MGVFPRSTPLEVKWSGGNSLGSEAYTLSKALAVMNKRAKPLSSYLARRVVWVGVKMT